MAITNTSKKPHHEWLFGLNPRAIEQQEFKGQVELINSNQLPKDLRGPYGDLIENSIHYFEMIGIKVLRSSFDDPLFYDVEFPEGWKITPTRLPLNRCFADSIVTAISSGWCP